MTHVEGCDFCLIAQGDSDETHILCEGESWLAFVPSEPATPGHTLVIPRDHLPDVWSLDEALGSELMKAVVRVGTAIRAALTPPGMNLISSSGEVAEQTVFHLHFHLLPRYEGDAMEIWPGPSKQPQDINERGVIDAIRNACRED